MGIISFFLPPAIVTKPPLKIVALKVTIGVRLPMILIALLSCGSVAVVTICLGVTADMG